MRESYLDYAMSVIVGRALPDIRDGLKPVHRRILYAMRDMGLTSSAKFRKSATVVGEVLGKYHPHGDAAAYDSMVRMAQDFSMRYPLVKGQGNFGSVDGDPPAAMRYTEAKMAPIAEMMLSDIEKDTVSFVDNYDGTKKEPTVLPTRIPNLLINGSMGIAVGMATNIPPHNLNEIIDGLIHLADNPDTDVTELSQYVKGPDFPTGGTLYGQNDIDSAYATGKGSVVIRAKAEIIETKKGGFQIIVTEIPYQTNKAELISKIATLVKDKKVEGIKDIRDESDKDGLRIAIDLKNDSFPKKILNQLYKYTEMQKAFHINMLGLIDGIQPQVFGLKLFLEKFLEHRKEVVARRTKHDLRKAEERAHILEGLKKALDHIDEIIKIIKKSASREDAFFNLIKRFKFSDRQTNAILDMRLQSLAGLERKKIDDELEEKRKLIDYLKSLLASPKKLLGVVKEEFNEIKEKYGDERKTKIVKSAVREIGEEELVPEEDSLFVITQGGYIKRMTPTILKAQKRGGKGLVGISTKEEDVVRHFFLANTHDDLMFFTNTGKVFQTKGYEVPESSRQSKGKSLANFLQIAQDSIVTAVIPVPKDSKKTYLFMVTSKGIVKKVDAEEFANVRRSGMIAIRLNKDDELGWVLATSGSDEILVAASNGSSIRFKEKDVRPMGRSAAGVLGIRLNENNAKVVGASIVSDGSSKGLKLFIAMANGYGKMTHLSSYKVQKRGGRGITTAKVTAKTGEIVFANVITEEDNDLIAISGKGNVIKTEISSIPLLGRATQGVRIMKLGQGDKIASAVIV
ncbi:MAG: DNA gyrase subunit A [Candidatus Yanofskybacteria bacterium CG10_big_fil_rev_8_21_14_0_10_36_16]|uniref:DNA gyrase subunit A n=1 Tax=Candidatus Yanofskybacteria bacterium CG10_big_fil_rev_8_21_14_0_10_36_16 TaxID=1975096 RepID=A0A2J0QA55_9BACT|nr:MAG: DNA gyrase subunit A [Candidatus Yanofskybacteria bacterium CG10_big_fil_rev_8_21_14_0_10_36_16]